LLPQWDFLDFLARHAKHHPGFALRMSTGVTDLLYEGDRVVGVRALAPDGPLEVRADVVVGADGRDSTVRAAAGLPVRTFGADGRVVVSAPDDRSRHAAAGAWSYRRGTHFRDARSRRLLAVRLRDRQGHRRRDSRARDRFVPERGLAAGRRAAGNRDEVKLLTVRVDRLTKWFRDGVLCIGDAAHAMSPVGGVGINLAIQDAVAAANLLTTPLRQGRVGVRDLARVQRRRTWPTRVTQRIQVLVQNRIVRRVLARERPLKPPFAVRVLARLPSLRRLTGRAIGLGVRPEHVGPVSQPLRRTA
jgi:2-polyprenyl-6-methoxyphenol hydroxylase-like FAD-dependent oxidoreductase